MLGRFGNDGGYKKGMGLYQDGRHGDALAVFESGLVQRPLDAMLHAGRALASQGLDREDECLSAFQTALALSPRDANLYVGYGGALLHFEHYEKAFAVFAEGLKLLPEDTQETSYRASVRAQLGRHKEVRAAFDSIRRQATISD